MVSEVIEALGDPAGAREIAGLLPADLDEPPVRHTAALRPVTLVEVAARCALHCLVPATTADRR